MKRILVLMVAVALAGCSPSEKSIQKAVARGDYQYIEKYIANPKYWNNPEKETVNAAAVEGLLLLSRIDKAVTLYNEYKGKPREEMILKAFVSAFEKGVLPQGAEKVVELREEPLVRAYVNALINSKPAKMPENILSIINDDKNEPCDALLRNAAVKIEPAIGLSNVKNYVGSAIDSRKKEEYSSAYGTINKAMLWDPQQGAFKESIDTLTAGYAELKDLSNTLSEKHSALESTERQIEGQKGEVKEYEQTVRTWQRDYNDFYNGNPTFTMLGFGCFNNYQSSYLCKEIFTKGLKDAKGNLNEERQKLKEIEAEAKALKKSIHEDEVKIKAKIPEVEAGETEVLAKLAEAGQKNP